MKKRIFAAVMCAVILVSLLSGCSARQKYQRVGFSMVPLGEEEPWARMFAQKTRIKTSVDKEFDDRFVLYEAHPRFIGKEDLEALAKYFGVEQEAVFDGKNSEDGHDAYYIRVKGTNDKGAETVLQRFSSCDDGRVSFSRYDTEDRRMEQTDEELIAEAQKLVDALPFLEGEYKCLGVFPERTVSTDTEKFVSWKRVAFRRYINGYRVIGDDCVDINFNSEGICEIDIMLFDYTEAETVKILSFKDALLKIRNPDGVSVIREGDGKFLLKDAADTITVISGGILYVNQYEAGCQVIQPVYNLRAVAENGNSSCEFYVRIVAVPEKYTYERDWGTAEPMP